MIILEGMDGSGKSTIAQRIGLPVVQPGAPPKTKELEAWFFETQLKAAYGPPVVYDRVTCISQQVYRKRLFDPWYIDPLYKLTHTVGVVVVYCRPPDALLLDLTRLKAAEHDTPEMLQLVRDNAETFVNSYDELMQIVPHVRYDFTRDNADDFVRFIRSTQGL